MCALGPVCFGIFGGSYLCRFPRGGMLAFERFVACVRLVTFRQAALPFPCRPRIAARAVLAGLAARLPARARRRPRRESLQRLDERRMIPSTFSAQPGGGIREGHVFEVEVTSGEVLNGLTKV